MSIMSILSDQVLFITPNHNHDFLLSARILGITLLELQYISIDLELIEVDKSKASFLLLCL